VTKILTLVAGLVLAFPCIRGFARWERQGKALRAVVLLLALELFEAAIYGNENLVPRGLFHPGSGSTQLRLPEIFITFALLGRLVAKKLPQRIGFPTMLWAAFGAWLAVEVVEGYIRGNSHAIALFQAKAIIYVVGGIALAGAVPVREYLDAEVFERLTRWFAPLLVVLDVMTAGHQAYTVSLPLLPLPSFGVIGSNAGTMFGALGLVTLILELGKKRRNLWTITCTIPLFLCTVLSGQRAALLGLGASVAFLLLATVASISRRRLRVRPAELVLGMAAVVALVLGIVFVPAAIGDRAPQVPFSSTVNSSFHSTGKAESAQARLNEFSLARQMIPHHLIIGTGLGFQYSYYNPGSYMEMMSDLTEDIYTDLWLRTGIIGLGLFVVAVLVSLGDGWRVWRRHEDRMVAVFAVALMAVVLGLLVKGGFESDFENYGLATILGLFFGMLRSAVTSAGTTLPVAQLLLDGRDVDERV